MKPRPLAVLAAGALAIFALGALSGYQMGSSKGRAESTKAAKTKAQLLCAEASCVYLTLAARADKAGNTAMAQRLQKLHLFGAALEIQRALDSGDADQAGYDRASGEGVIKDVAAIFWSDPAWIDTLDGDPLRRHLKPEVQAMFNRYRP
jgi:hypothetical protein